MRPDVRSTKLATSHAVPRPSEMLPARVRRLGGVPARAVNEPSLSERVTSKLELHKKSSRA
jgi:hypothetical protein